MRWLWKRSPKRTLILGIVALGVLLWGAVSQFEVPRERVVDALLATLTTLAFIILLAALSVALWVGLRRLFSRSDD